MQGFHHLPGAMSAADCDRLIDLAAAAPLRDGGLDGGVMDSRIRRAGLVWVDDLPGAGWVMDAVTDLVARANRDAFGFDLSDFAESAQVARYDAHQQGHFDWHTDIGAGTLAARRKLTVVVQLSDPDDYDGGALEGRPGSTVAVAPRARGQATVFPSFVLHRVTPVTTGVRWSLTLWAHGPAFR